MGATKFCVLVIVAVCVYHVHTAALPDNENEDGEVQLRAARPASAIVGRAGAKKNKKNAKKQPNKTANKVKKVKTAVGKKELLKTTKKGKGTPAPTNDETKELISKKHETFKQPSPKNIDNKALKEVKSKEQPPKSADGNFGGPPYYRSPATSNSDNLGQVVSSGSGAEGEVEEQIPANFNKMLRPNINKMLPPDMKIMAPLADMSKEMAPELNRMLPAGMNRMGIPDVNQMASADMSKILPQDVNQMAPSDMSKIISMNKMLPDFNRMAKDASKDFPTDDVMPSLLNPAMRIQI